MAFKADDLLNSRIHIEDTDFALDEGLLPKNLSVGKISIQFTLLAQKAELNEKQVKTIFESIISNTDRVTSLINASYLKERLKRNYLQSYLARLKKLF